MDLMGDLQDVIFRNCNASTKDTSVCKSLKLMVVHCFLVCSLLLKVEKEFELNEFSSVNISLHFCRIERLDSIMCEFIQL